MRRIFLFLALALLAVDAAAQQYPERRQVRKGNRAYDKGNYQDAAGRYMRALGTDPASFEARYDLGNAFHRQELYDQAAQAQQQAAADSLAAPAARAEAFYNLGNTQFRQQKYAEALESYKHSLRLNPDDRQAKFNYAYVKKLLDDQQQNQDNQDNKDNENNENDRNQDQRNDRNESDPQQGKDDPQDSDPQSDDDSQQDDDRQQGDEPQQDERPDKEQEGEGQPRPAGISPAEQERMLDAIQAQEDKTQEKLKEKAGAVVRLRKNW